MDAGDRLRLASLVKNVVDKLVWAAMNILINQIQLFWPGEVGPVVAQSVSI
jgi:hypothetical protein